MNVFVFYPTWQKEQRHSNQLGMYLLYGRRHRNTIYLSKDRSLQNHNFPNSIEEKPRAVAKFLHKITVSIGRRYELTSKLHGSEVFADRPSPRLARFEILH